jgi:hypothetical protein
MEVNDMFFKLLMAAMIGWLIGSAVLKRQASIEAMKENPSAGRTSIYYGWGWIRVEGIRAKRARNATIAWVVGGFVLLTACAFLGPFLFPNSYRH